MVNAWLVPAVWVADPVTRSREAEAAVTTTASRSLPAAESVPSLTAIFGDSALYSFIVPLAAPARNASDVFAEPKAWSAAKRSRNVGAVTGLVELDAPVTVSVWLPV